MLSVVVPIFNEAENLPELLRRLTEACAGTGMAYELVFVNDGSTDGSGALLRAANEADSRVKVVELSRNFGHQPALTAGVHAASGEAVVLLDGDLQDPPELIGEMVQAWRGGAKVVLAQRRTRADNHGLRGIGYRLFYPLLRKISDLPDAPQAGIYALLDRVVVEQFNRLPERGRFIPGLRSWLGFTQASVMYDRDERRAGKPKQSLRRLLHYAADAIFSFSYKPLRVATWMGFIVSAAAFLLAAYYFVTFFAFRKTAGSGFTTLILCMLFLGGVQLVCVGILGEYIARIYEEVKQRPLYVVSEKIGFGDEKAGAKQR